MTYRGRRTLMAAVRADLEWLELGGTVSGREALCTLALRLAKRFDELRPRRITCPTCQTPIALEPEPGAAGLLAVRLANVMAKLPTTRASDALDDLLDRASTPRRDTPQP